MKPWTPTEGQLDATFAVDGHGPDFEISFESGDGNGRNSQYKRGVEVVLSRLGDLGATLLSARISSDRVERRVAGQGLASEFEPKTFRLPLALGAGVDHVLLRKRLGGAGGLVGAAPGSKGSVTRRMTLSVRLPGPSLSRLELEACLVGEVDELPFEAPSVLSMVQDLAVCDDAFAAWIAALTLGSRPVRGARRWMPAERVMFATSPSNKRPGAIDTRLSVRASGAPWTVEINAPKAVADANGTATVAVDGAGRLHLLRQGKLQANPDSDGEIFAEHFSRWSGIAPVKVSGGTTPTPRQWYLVAELERPAEEIRRQTGAFVEACARARRLSLPGQTAPPRAPSLFAAGEKGGVFRKKAVAAQPETEVRRLQGEVWLALASRLEARGLEITKPRHEAGYEVDGVIDTPTGSILLEIKTARSAADVYEGVGQLLLYGDMLGLAGHRRILLLRDDPNPVLTQAALAHRVEIHTYQLHADGDVVTVRFSQSFLQACGLNP